MAALKTILVAHPWMGRGGSEATAMWTLQTLQREAAVSFTTASDVDWQALNDAYGTSVDPDLIEMIPAPRIPGVNSGTQLVDLQNSLFIHHCRQLADQFDECISAYNVIDFGKPGIQLIGDFSWSETLRRVLYPNAEDKFKHRKSTVRSLYLKLGKWIRGSGAPVAERGDRFLANSRWTQQILKRSIGVSSEILYPPVLIHESTGRPVRRNAKAFVIVGRISPEKEIEQSIAILDRLREFGHTLTLHIAGAPGGDEAYVERVNALIAERPWITKHGFLPADELEKLLRSCSFGLHACTIEAFGIAVAEMAAQGCLPFVPHSGGGVEVVTDPRLHYANIDEAVSRIEALLLHPEKAELLRQETRESIARFSPDRFSTQLRSLVLEKTTPTNHVTRSQTTVSTH